MSFKAIPGLTGPASGDLPVLKAPAPVLRGGLGGAAPPSALWVAQLRWWHGLVLLAALVTWSAAASAQSNYTNAQAFDALLRWIPFLFTEGFLFNVLISFLSMAVGTIAGLFLGLGQVSLSPLIRRSSWAVTQFFRNSPWLVLLFCVMLLFPFEIVVGRTIIPIPDWTKAVIGFSLPVMANLSEVVRGAIQSIPTGQWESAESLAFSRRQTMWMIILPQCVKRMLPPWMNWYAILTMATPLCSIMGVEEALNLTRQAIEAEDNHPELLAPFYGFLLAVFFLYCYPIARWTIRLERKFAVKL